ncbi:DUF6221 family protein [Streptomyces sp. NPDC002073]
MTTPARWIGFLRARVAEERRLAHAAAVDGWWEPTGPASGRVGLEAGGRTFASVLTGRGTAGDHTVIRHILANQPGRTLEDLDAKDRLLDACEPLGDGLPPQLLAVIRQFAEPFQDHHDHPEYTPETL